MKNKALAILFIGVFLMVFSTCKKDTGPNMSQIKINKETERVEVETTEVTITGTYEFSGKINAIKVRVSTSEQLFGSDLHIADVNDNAYSVHIVGLHPGTKYYYRYEVDYGNSADWQSDIWSFSTLSELPVVNTMDILEIDSTTYRIKCRVVSDGGQEVTERGICWNTYGDPTIDDSKIAYSEGGIGEYSVWMENLFLSRKYFVRAYAKSAAGVGYGEEIMFETPSIVGMLVDIKLSSNPVDGGTVSGSGTYAVGSLCTIVAHSNPSYKFVNWTENGVQVSSDESYTFTVRSESTLVANFTSGANVITVKADPEEGGIVSGSGGYDSGDECVLNATPKTGYTFINWTLNGSGVSTDASYSFTVTGSATYVAHFQANHYVIAVSADPTNGGEVSGGGSYNYNQSCTIHANAKTGYAFVNWTDENQLVSTDSDYTFMVTNNRVLVAHFSPIQSNEYSIQVLANPNYGGIVTGGGTYQQGQQCTITATANSGYVFTNWTENGNVVSTNANYTFTVNGNRDLVANFAIQSNVPTGAINGLFNVGPRMVYFSKGNLQYQASTNTWRFAEHQYDYIGDANQYASSYFNGWIDLFGWGTSGWYSGNTYYHPWDTDYSDPTLYGPPGQYNLTGTYANADWGVYNAITNGGGQAGLWSTLTKDEWVYVFNARSASTVNGIANARYVKAKVNNVQGVILFPDNYMHPFGVAQPIGINETGNIGWRENNYNAADFELMQQNGVVFLPAAGWRRGTRVSDVGDEGFYWSASYRDSLNAYIMFFYPDYLDPQNGSGYCDGRSVRLVAPAEN